MKIAIVTLFDPPFFPVGKLCAESLKVVGPRMGCDVIVHTNLMDPDLAPSWNKLLAVRDQLEWNDWVWWVDGDCLIVKPVDIQSILNSYPRNVDLIPAHDWNGICLGTFCLRSCLWSRRWLDALLFCGDVADNEVYGPGCGPKWEQNAMKALMGEFPDVAAHVGTFVPELLTDGPERDTGWAFPVHHYGGRTIEQRVGPMTTELSRIKSASRKVAQPTGT